MAVGTIKCFDQRKGFGFITPDAGGPDIYVHVSAVERAGLSRVLTGDRVSFVTQTDKARGKTVAASLALI